MLADLVRVQVVDIRFAVFDQLDGPFIELSEVVGREAEALPVKAKPADICLNRVYIFLLFLLGIGVVESQIGAPAELVGETEIKANRFGVPNVEISVRLRRKARLHVRVLAGLQIIGNLVAKKIG